MIEIGGVLTPLLCRQLAGLTVGDGAMPSPMVPERDGRVAVIDRRMKARADHRLMDPALVGTVAAAFADALLPHVREHFGFAPMSFESFKVVRYDAGEGWFRPHRDNVSVDSRHRRVAVSLNLSDGYDGGELAFPELDVAPWRGCAGTALVFECGLLHEVLPVTRGRRDALITFLW